MFELVVLLTVTKANDINAVADALARMRPLCLAEPGCISWEALHSQNDPLRFTLVETWATQEHWTTHGELSAMQDIYLPNILPRVTREIHPSIKLGHPA